MSTTTEGHWGTGAQSVAAREKLLLAPYAMHSVQSAGRKHPEPDHPYRGPYQRDRDRIVHSAAFRRLSGKMQVFTGEMGDYHRTRLTHTMEVASIARTLGRALRLNEDLIEALALLHDIGHPPFGHAGEDALNECLADDGGFSHNRHALTLVEELERRYSDRPGLNLTREVLEGQMARAAKNAKGVRPLLEVQIVDVADSMTYDAHDVDDAIKLELVTLEELFQIPLAGLAARHVHQRNSNIHGSLLRKAVVHDLIDRQVSDVIENSIRFLASCHWESPEGARHSDFVIGPSQEIAAQKAELEAFLFERVYRHPRLARQRSKAQDWLREMFQGLLRRPELLPLKFRHRAKTVGLRRTAAEYLAGMTDRFAVQQYQQHFAAY